VPRKVFVAGEILTAADVNTNLMDQAVMSFAGTAARGSAIPSPVEGMAAYLNDSNILSLYDGSAWKNSLATTGGILQIVSTTKTDTFTTASASYVDVTGLSATITPISATNKIWVILSIGSIDSDSSGFLPVQVLRDSTAIGVGDLAGSRKQAGIFLISPSDNRPISASWNFLDSPNSTSSLTYKAQLAVSNASNAFINRSRADDNASGYARSVSSITLIEVAA
jgi:hypothetical protein